MKKLPLFFYNRNTIEVATRLLGCQIICNTDGIKTGGIIVETEAYHGPEDPACHAFKGHTRRNDVMYGQPGFLYVYFTYGNHFMLNVVTEKEGFPAAVLLRGIEPRYNIEIMAKRRGTDDLTNISSGPGKLAKALNVTGPDNGTDLTGSHIYILGPPDKKPKIIASPRIGIGIAGSELLWRFHIDGNAHVSKPNKWIKESSYSLAEAKKLGFVLPEER
ncbi:MAG TPA: DNA-3-methyladenine glycosylase [candidate division Zixibacteria bacterium]|jgi:DNA-3-methyladenine glycosylase|nr:DNA-3-methyladenine glycosylase [candidate division Zixibacteria bacterium]HBZ02054.1 DNA-3-methyladenine glycosylase [candidate division Zixibacteria bacterium]